MKRLLTNLTFWVLLAIAAGILIGHLAPGFALQQVLSRPWKAHWLGQDLAVNGTLSELLSGGFISLVKLFINPIIFLTITLGISSMGDLGKVGRVGVKALLYFEIVTTLALGAGVLAALLIRPGQGTSTALAAGSDVSAYTRAGGFSWSRFLLDNSTLQVLLVALVAGMVLNRYGSKDRIVDLLHRVARYLFSALHKVMLLAPVGAFGGMAFTIAKFGIHTLLPLGKLMATVYLTMAIFILGILGSLLRYYRISIFRYLRYIREELLVVLGTSSSEAALPSLMEKLERMGCSRSVVGLVVPTGYSFNLDGTTLYLSLCMIFLAQAYGVHLSLGQVLVIIGILMVTSKGAAGVTGSGFAVLASTLTAIKVIPIEGLTLLLGVDRFMSEARALTNFIGNGIATIWIAHNEKEFDRDRMHHAFSHLGQTENIVSDNLSDRTIEY
ncbi:MAG TPA: cation:dicarboxylase symporter family transporter [Chitinophagaceae bacterium]|nr:cation:dicarboxylase symporter family transporter [Chitinophagaceae bacterium]